CRNAPPTPSPYTLSLHDALPISRPTPRGTESSTTPPCSARSPSSTGAIERSEIGLATPVLLAPDKFKGSLTAAEVAAALADGIRSEEHTSELQSRENLVCRLLLE